MVDTSTIEANIVHDLILELYGEDNNFNENILKVKVKGAIRDVIMRRNYEATSYTDAQILKDLERFYSVILNVARYDYNQVGVEGEISHNEPGASRTWIDRNKLFRGVSSFAKIL